MIPECQGHEVSEGEQKASKMLLKVIYGQKTFLNVTYAVAWCLQKDDRGQMPQADINFPREEEEIWGRGKVSGWHRTALWPSKTGKQCQDGILIEKKIFYHCTSWTEESWKQNQSVILGHY